MKNQRIISLADLKEWNANPTKEKPIVMEWIFDEIFERAIDVGKWDYANELVAEFVEFARICEKKSKEEAIALIKQNLDYYSRYVLRWEIGLKKLDLFKE